MFLIVIMYSPVPWIRSLDPLATMMTAGMLIGTIGVWVMYKRSQTLQGR